MLLRHTIQATESLGVIRWLGLEHFIVSNNHLFMALGSWCRFKSNVLCCSCCSKMVALIHVPLSLLPGVKSIFWVYFQLVSIRPHLVDVRWSWRTFYWNVLTKQWIIFGFALWIRRFRFCFIIYFVVFFLMKDLTSLLCHSLKVRLFYSLMLILEYVKFMQDQEFEVYFLIRKEKSKVRKHHL